MIIHEIFDILAWDRCVGSPLQLSFNPAHAYLFGGPGQRTLSAPKTI